MSILTTNNRITDKNCGSKLTRTHLDSSNIAAPSGSLPGWLHVPVEIKTLHGCKWPEIYVNTYSNQYKSAFLSYYLQMST